jgi:hypothetical protein
LLNIPIAIVYMIAAISAAQFMDRATWMPKPLFQMLVMTCMIGFNIGFIYCDTPGGLYVLIMLSLCCAVVSLSFSETSNETLTIPVLSAGHFAPSYADAARLRDECLLARIYAGFRQLITLVGDTSSAIIPSEQTAKS